MDKRNKGFTMIELLVSLGVASIVFALIFSFFITNYKSFKTISTESELQFQSQYILNYMASKINNSKSISNVRDGPASYALNTLRNAQTEYPVTKISFKYGDKDTENYIFGIAIGNKIRYDNGVKDKEPEVALGIYVDKMYVVLYKNDCFENVRALKIKIVMKKGNQTYEAFQAVCMKN